LRIDDLDQLLEFVRTTGTSQLYIEQDGKVLLDEVIEEEPVDVFAVQKGILTLLMGIAEEKYLLEIIDPVNHHLDPEWTKLSPWDEAKLTIEILLNMTTGMDDELGPLGTIDKTWRYNNTAYNYLKKILCLHTGQSLDELSREWLFEPLAMVDTRWVERSQQLPDGTPVTGLLSTARDLAQVGLMVLNGGKVNGGDVIPGHFLQQLARPGSDENPAWGLCWWNNDQDKYRIPMSEEKSQSGPAIPGAPSDLIAARGAFENYLYVVPSEDLVVARTAKPPTEKQQHPSFESEFWSLMVG
jgi:CubicO group peptidase (beta-lactamase class C family)